MELFVVDQFRREFERRGDVIDRNAVFARDIRLRHAGGETSQHARHRYTRPANHRFPVLNSRVDCDARVHGAIVTSLQQPRQQKIRHLLCAIGQVVLLLR